MTLTEGAASGTADTDATTGTYNNPGSNIAVGTDTANRFKLTLATPTGVSSGSVLAASAYTNERPSAPPERSDSEGLHNSRFFAD